MGLLKNLFGQKQQQTPAPTPVPVPQERKMYKEEFQVVGEFYCKDNIKKLRTANPDYKKPVPADGQWHNVDKYTYINKPVKLVEEPDNPHDHNAVMVLVAGEKVGYISQNDNLHVKDILVNGSIKYITSFFKCGERKTYAPDGTFVEHKDETQISIRIGYSR